MAEVKEESKVVIPAGPLPTRPFDVMEEFVGAIKNAAEDIKKRLVIADRKQDLAKVDMFHDQLYHTLDMYNNVNYSEIIPRAITALCGTEGRPRCQKTFRELCDIGGFQFLVNHSKLREPNELWRETFTLDIEEKEHGCSHEITSSIRLMPNKEGHLVLHSIILTCDKAHSADFYLFIWEAIYVQVGQLKEHFTWNKTVKEMMAVANLIVKQED